MFRRRRKGKRRSSARAPPAPSAGAKDPVGAQVPVEDPVEQELALRMPSDEARGNVGDENEMLRQISLPREWEWGEGSEGSEIQGGNFEFGFESVHTSQQLISELQKLAANPAGPVERLRSAAVAVKERSPELWTDAVKVAFRQAIQSYAAANRNQQQAAGGAATAESKDNGASSNLVHFYGVALQNSSKHRQLSQHISFSQGDLLRLARCDNNWYYAMKQTAPIDGEAFPPAGANLSRTGKVHTSQVQVVCRMYRLPTSSEEGQKVAEMFTSTSGQSSFPFITVDRIQTKDLWEDYYILRERMFKLLGGQINEKTMWHGCAGPVVLPIAAQGFDWRLCGLHGTAYGRGAYFAKNSSYSKSDRYSAPDSDTRNKHMFLCRVLLGRSVQGNGSLQRPPPGFHSAVNTNPSNADAATIGVTFDVRQAYPMYHVTFRTS